MIDPGWLAQNEKYDVESRIVDSGVAWGDAEEPEALAEKRKRVKEEKRDIAQNKRIRLTGNTAPKTKALKKKGKAQSGKGKEKESIAGPSSPAGPAVGVDDTEDEDSLEYD
jgi:hypothetical protein